MGCDSLLGRIKREFDRGQITIFPLGRVRSLAHVAKETPAKKRRLAPDVLVEFENDEAYSDEKNANKVFFLCNQLDVLATTWAVAGCYDTAAKDKQGNPVKFVHWQDACEYVEEIQKRAIRLLATSKEASVVTFMLDLDAHLRAAAVEMIRAEEVDGYGEALKAVLKSEHHIFRDFEDNVEPKFVGNIAGGPWIERARQRLNWGAQKQRDNRPTKSPGAKGGKKGNKNKKGDKGKGKGGICSAFNSPSGCNKRNCEKEHLCSARTKDGKFCNSRKHGRANHPE